MAESSDAYSEIRNIRLELDQQGHMLNALVRYHPEVREQILAELKKDEVMKITYQLIDGKLSQDEIIKELLARKVKGASPANAAKKLQRLRDDLNIISVLGMKGKSIVYIHNRLGKSLRLLRSLGKLDK